METPSQIRDQKRQRLVGHIEQTTHGISRLKDLDQKFSLALVLLAVTELKKTRVESASGVEPSPEISPEVEAVEASRLYAYVQWHLDRVATTPAERMVLLHKIVIEWLNDGVGDFYALLEREESCGSHIIPDRPVRMELPLARYEP
jgi:hypothetical protein